MPYPSRPRLQILPEFAGSASVHQTPEPRQRLLTFVEEQYRAGRSIHELAELTGRSQTAIRRALEQGGVSTRGAGAPLVDEPKRRRRA